MQDANIYFKESSDGWVLEVSLFDPKFQSHVWTYIATFGSKAAAEDYFKEHYSE
jgi:hypothetical protein